MSGPEGSGGTDSSERIRYDCPTHAEFDGFRLKADTTLAPDPTVPR